MQQQPGRYSGSLRHVPVGRTATAKTNAAIYCALLTFYLAFGYFSAAREREKS
jgi:hypothetical protein